MNKKIMLIGLVAVGCLLLINVAWASKPAETRESSTGTKWEKRCGWFENPTPSNAWLVDKDGEWTISIQGGHQAEGDWPDFKPGQWVETNVHYGYGCACMEIQANHKTKEVAAIRNAKARPLAVCRKDRSLPKP